MNNTLFLASFFICSTPTFAGTFAGVLNQDKTFVSLQDEREQLDVFTCNNAVTVHWQYLGESGMPAPFDLTGVLPDNASDIDYIVKISGAGPFGKPTTSLFRVNQGEGAYGLPMTFADFFGSAYQLTATRPNSHCK